MADAEAEAEAAVTTWREVCTPPNEPLQAPSASATSLDSLAAEKPLGPPSGCISQTDAPAGANPESLQRRKSACSSLEVPEGSPCARDTPRLADDVVIQVAGSDSDASNKGHLALSDNDNDSDAGTDGIRDTVQLGKAAARMASTASAAPRVLQNTQLLTQAVHLGLPLCAIFITHWPLGQLYLLLALAFFLQSTWFRDEAPEQKHRPSQRLRWACFALAVASIAALVGVQFLPVLRHLCAQGPALCEDLGLMNWAVPFDALRCITQLWPDCLALVLAALMRTPDARYTPWNHLPPPPRPWCVLTWLAAAITRASALTAPLLLIACVNGFLWTRHTLVVLPSRAFHTLLCGVALYCGLVLLAQCLGHWRYFRDGHPKLSLILGLSDNTDPVFPVVHTLLVYHAFVQACHAIHSSGAGVTTEDAALSRQDDDAQEEVSSGEVSVHPPALGLQPSLIVGLRFTLPAPPDSDIRCAELRFVATGTSDAETQCMVAAEAADDAAPFTAEATSLSARPRTWAEVQWAPGPWRRDRAYRCAGLRAVVQEVVSRPGWEAGNCIAFLIKTSCGTREACSSEGPAVHAAKFRVQWKPSDGKAEAALRRRRRGVEAWALWLCSTHGLPMIIALIVWLAFAFPSVPAAIWLTLLFLSHFLSGRFFVGLLPVLLTLSCVGVLVLFIVEVQHKVCCELQQEASLLGQLMGFRVYEPLNLKRHLILGTAILVVLSCFAWFVRGRSTAHHPHSGNGRGRRWSFAATPSPLVAPGLEATLAEVPAPRGCTLRRWMSPHLRGLLVLTLAFLAIHDATLIGSIFLVVFMLYFLSERAAQRTRGLLLVYGTIVSFITYISCLLPDVSNTALALVGLKGQDSCIHEWHTTIYMLVTLLLYPLCVMEFPDTPQDLSPAVPLQLVQAKLLGAQVVCVAWFLGIAVLTPISLLSMVYFVTTLAMLMVAFGSNRALVFVLGAMTGFVALVLQYAAQFAAVFDWLSHAHPWAVGLLGLRQYDVPLPGLMLWLLSFVLSGICIRQCRIVQALEADEAATKRGSRHHTVRRYSVILVVVRGLKVMLIVHRSSLTLCALFVSSLLCRAEYTDSAGAVVELHTTGFGAVYMLLMLLYTFNFKWGPALLRPIACFCAVVMVASFAYQLDHPELPLNTRLLAYLGVVRCSERLSLPRVLVPHLVVFVAMLLQLRTFHWEREQKRRMSHAQVPGYRRPPSADAGRLRRLLHTARNPLAQAFQLLRTGSTLESHSDDLVFWGLLLGACLDPCTIWAWGYMLLAGRCLMQLPCRMFEGRWLLLVHLIGCGILILQFLLLLGLPPLPQLEHLPLRPNVARVRAFWRDGYERYFLVAPVPHQLVQIFIIMCIIAHCRNQRRKTWRKRKSVLGAQYGLVERLRDSWLQLEEWIVHRPSLSRLCALLPPPQGVPDYTELAHWRDWVRYVRYFFMPSLLLTMALLEAAAHEPFTLISILRLLMPLRLLHTGSQCIWRGPFLWVWLSFTVWLTIALQMLSQVPDIANFCARNMDFASYSGICDTAINIYPTALLLGLLQLQAYSYDNLAYVYVLHDLCRYYQNAERRAQECLEWMQARAQREKSACKRNERARAQRHHTLKNWHLPLTHSASFCPGSPWVPRLRSSDPARESRNLMSFSSTEIQTAGPPKSPPRSPTSAPRRRSLGVDVPNLDVPKHSPLMQRRMFDLPVLGGRRPSAADPPGISIEKPGFADAYEACGDAVPLITVDAEANDDAARRTAAAGVAEDQVLEDAAPACPQRVQASGKPQDSAESPADGDNGTAADQALSQGSAAAAAVPGTPTHRTPVHVNPRASQPVWDGEELQSSLDPGFFEGSTDGPTSKCRGSHVRFSVDFEMPHVKSEAIVSSDDDEVCLRRECDPVGEFSRGISSLKRRGFPKQLFGTKSFFVPGVMTHARTMWSTLSVGATHKSSRDQTKSNGTRILPTVGQGSASRIVFQTLQVLLHKYKSLDLRNWKIVTSRSTDNKFALFGTMVSTVSISIFPHRHEAITGRNEARKCVNRRHGRIRDMGHET